MSADIMSDAKTKSQVRFVDNGDGTVTDKRKNLMWMKDDTWVELGRLVSWWESQEILKKKNAEKFGGHSDWRMPNAIEAKELFDVDLSNIDMQKNEIHIDPVFTSGCGHTTWTVETRGAKAAMGYDYRSDYEYWLAKENIGFPSSARLVRRVTKKGRLPHDQRYVDHKNGTISDLETGLMWKASDSFLDWDKWVSWEEAKVFAKVLNQEQFAGYENWRLPTRKEAGSIHDPSCPNTDTYGDIVYLPAVFPPGSGQSTWTKTLHKTDQSLAMRFNYFSGNYKFHKKGLRSHGIRAVRNIEKIDEG